MSKEAQQLKARVAGLFATRYVFLVQSLEDNSIAGVYSSLEKATEAHIQTELACGLLARDYSDGVDLVRDVTYSVIDRPKYKIVVERIEDTLLPIYSHAGCESRIVVSNASICSDDPFAKGHCPLTRMRLTLDELPDDSSMEMITERYNSLLFERYH